MPTWLEGNSCGVKNADTRNLTSYQVTKNSLIHKHSIFQ
jgi:hypothetical protein